MTTNSYNAFLRIFAVSVFAVFMAFLSAQPVYALSLADEITNQINELSDSPAEEEVIKTDTSENHTPAVEEEIPIENEDPITINEEDLEAIEEYTNDSGEVIDNEELLTSPQEEVEKETSSESTSNTSNSGSIESPFPDVPASHPNAKAIAFLKDEGIVKGNADGTYRPDAILNRAESLAIILRSMNIAIQKGLGSKASDINSGDWFYDVVNTAYVEGIANGNPDGTFTPGGSVNQAAFLKLVLKSAGTDTSKYSGVNWYDEFVDYAKMNNIIDNKTPAENISRAAAAEIIYRVLNK